MNAWVRRSLSASLIAGGFGVLGAGVASADEIGAPDADKVGQTASQLTGKVNDATGGVSGATEGVRSTAEGTVEQAKAQVPAAAAQAPTERSAAPADAVGQVKGVVDQAAPQAQGAARSVTDKVGETTGQPLERPVPLPAPETGARQAAQAGDVVVPVTSSVDRTVPLSVDLGDLGNAATVTDVVGTVDGVAAGRLDSHGLSGITSVIGVLDTASTLAAEVPGVATVDASSVTSGVVDGAGDVLVDISNGHVHGFGALGGMLANVSTLDVDAGDLGYLSTTTDVYAWADAVVDAALDLPSGDVYGFVAAAAGIDAVLTADGQLADLAGLSGVVTTSALVDAFVEATGNLADGELNVVGGVYSMLNATADIDGWIDGIGDVALSPTLSSVMDETHDLLEVSL